MRVAVESGSVERNLALRQGGGPGNAIADNAFQHLELSGRCCYVECARSVCIGPCQVRPCINEQLHSLRISRLCSVVDGRSLASAGLIEGESLADQVLDHVSAAVLGGMMQGGTTLAIYLGQVGTRLDQIDQAQELASFNNIEQTAGGGGAHSHIQNVFAFALGSSLSR
jgi:hypothetical protein